MIFSIFYHIYNTKEISKMCLCHIFDYLIIYVIKRYYDNNVINIFNDITQYVITQNKIYKINLKEFIHKHHLYTQLENVNFFDLDNYINNLKISIKKKEKYLNFENIETIFNTKIYFSNERIAFIIFNYFSIYIEKN